MPFLHGFRRIIYEYQPLVDAIMRVIGMEEDQDYRLLLRHKNLHLRRSQKRGIGMKGSNFCFQSAKSRGGVWCLHFPGGAPGARVPF